MRLTFTNKDFNIFVEINSAVVIKSSTSLERLSVRSSVTYGLAEYFPSIMQSGESEFFDSFQHLIPSFWHCHLQVIDYPE